MSLAQKTSEILNKTSVTPISRHPVHPPMMQFKACLLLTLEASLTQIQGSLQACNWHFTAPCAIGWKLSFL